MRETITGGDRRPYAAPRMDHAAAPSPRAAARGFSVKLILIRFTVATNTAHVKILSSVLRCMLYAYTFLFACVCVCVV